MADESDDPTEDKRLKLKWLENPNHDRARRSRKQEDRIAEKMGGRRLPRSGGKDWSKRSRAFAMGGPVANDEGDISTPELHVEHKRTDKKSMSIKREWLDKVREGARKVGKDPALVITFEEPNKPTSQPEDWILVPLEVATRVLGYSDEE